MRIALSLLIFSLLCAGSAAAGPPNIVLLIGDDLGWPYTGFMGDPVARTPTLDALAAEGTVFTQGQVPAPVCGPSLQTLLAGIHPRQWVAKRQALRALHDSVLPRQEVVHYRTLPRALQHLAYASWQGGKMWEGSYEQAGFTHGLATQVVFPVNEGDDFGRTDWDPRYCGPTGDPAVPCPALEPVRAFFDDIGAAPFFLWYAPKLPHSPFTPPAEYILEYWRTGLPLAVAIFYAQITWLDAVIGELLAELDERGLRDDTLLIFLSDNGWERGQGIRRNLRKGKGTLHELGTRTPIVFHWPGRVPSGVVRDDLVAAADLFPTILDYAGAEPLPDRRGRSLRRAIETGAPFGRERVVSFYDGTADAYRGHFVRTPRWRYISSIDGREQLYEVAVDPRERDDLAAERPDLLEAFRAEVMAWEAGIAIPPERLEAAGRLVDANGEPIAGAALRLEGDATRLQVLTDRNGHFRFRDLPLGDYLLSAGRRVRALSAGASEGEIPISLPVGPLGAYLPKVVGTPRGALVAPNESSISGVVATEDLEPLPDARVTVSGVGGRRLIRVIVRTDAQGRYLAENLPAGRYRVRAEVPRGMRRPLVRVVLGEDERRELDLVAALAGTRRAASRDPILPRLTRRLRP